MSDQAATTNAERVRRLLRMVDALDVDSLIEQFADDAVMELPFAPGSMPRRYEGREEIHGFQRYVQGSFSSFSMVCDAIHETADPNVVIAEHHSEGVVTETGREYRNRYCTVFTFGPDGRVVGWREYYDAGAVVAAFRPSR